MKVRWTIERAMEEPPPIFHPLAGCDWENFQAHLSSHGGFSQRTAAQRAKSRLAVLARHPFTKMERVIFSKKVENYQLPHPPTFLIGHWRSGTTHLHNLIAPSRHFATIDFGQTAMPHNLLNPTRFIGRAAMSLAIPKDRGMDAVKMGLKEPQEEEMALGNMNQLCYYNVFYYPQNMKSHFDRSIFMEGVSDEEQIKFEDAYRLLVRKLSIAGKDKPLLLKNPASTARIEILNRLFEGARFIHIVRNPFDVFASMLHHYPRLLNAFAWQDFDKIDLEEMVFYKYRRVMDGYLAQRQIVGDRLLETSYETIVADPACEIGRFFDHFDFRNKDSAMKSIGRYVEQNLNYRRNRYHLTRAQVDRIHDEWGFALKEWGYSQPDTIEVA